MKGSDAKLSKLWQTDLVRPWPATVHQEVQCSLDMMPVICDVVPAIMRDLRHALAEFYPDYPR